MGRGFKPESGLQTKAFLNVGVTHELLLIDGKVKVDAKRPIHLSDERFLGVWTVS